MRNKFRACIGYVAPFPLVEPITKVYQRQHECFLFRRLYGWHTIAPFQLGFARMPATDHADGERRKIGFKPVAILFDDFIQDFFAYCFHILTLTQVRRLSNSFLQTSERLATLNGIASSAQPLLCNPLNHNNIHHQSVRAPSPGNHQLSRDIV